MSKQVIITRKIQLLFNTTDKDEIKRYYELLNYWQLVCYKAANFISVHKYMQEFMKDLFYVKDDAMTQISKASISTPEEILQWTMTADITHVLHLFSGKKEEAKTAIFETSEQNTTYRLLSKKWKGQIPMAIITLLNSVITQTFNKERVEYAQGIRSLRTYKRDLPIPIRSPDIINFRKNDETYKGKVWPGYAFTLYNIPFKTRFGIDLSGNRIIFGRMFDYWNIEKPGKDEVEDTNRYDLLDSSIKIDKTGKIFLLAVFSFSKDKISLDPERSITASLSVDTPITVTMGDKVIQIGGREEFLYQRQVFQARRRKIQTHLRYAKGGHGRTEKLKALDKLGTGEANYVNTKLHGYARKLIDLAIKYNAGKIILKEQTKKEKEVEETKDTDQGKFVLRNWSYGGMQEKLQYKANRVGIIIEKE